MFYNQFINNFVTQNLENPSSEMHSSFIDDPTTMGFNLWFDFSESSPLLNDSTRGESAAAYLSDCYGDALLDVNNNPTPLWHLQKFKEKLKYLMNYTPYYYQKISGLDEVYKFDPKVAWNQMVLTIDTLESIDLRIGGMAYHYINAVYDTKNRKFIVPVNLRYFNFVVTISEIRSLRTFTKEVVKDSDFGLKQRDINPMLDFWAFQFKNSEFDFSASNPFFDGASNAKLEYVTNQFKIKCGPMLDQSRIGWFSLNPNNIPPLSKVDYGGVTTARSIVKDYAHKAEQLVKDFAEAQAANVQAGLRAKFVDPLADKITQAEFGNVFFRGGNVNLFNIVTGDQPLEALNPLAGRYGDFSSEVAKINLKAGSENPPSNGTYLPQVLENLLQNSLGEVASKREEIINAILGNQILANLGSIFR